MKKDKEFAEYLEKVARYKKEFPNNRSGQSYNNVLYQFRPKLAKMINATSLDPYYLDGLIPDFLDHVLKNWDKYD